VGSPRALHSRWCAPPRPDAPPPTAGCAATAHGLLLPFFSMCGGGGGRARSSRRREAPGAPSALSSRGWLEEAGKQSRQRWPSAAHPDGGRGGACSGEVGRPAAQPREGGASTGSRRGVG
jgi:hypothetical protein